MILNRKILFLQFLSNILIICLVLLTIRKVSIDINIIYFCFFILVLTYLDSFFLYEVKDSPTKSFLFFNISRYLAFIIGYMIFYFAYYYPNNQIISVIAPNEYFDSGMYVYVAKNLVNGLSVADTDFALYYGAHMSPNWALIVYIYTGMFLIFGIEEQILPMINLFIYSYIFFFFIYILKMTNLTKNQIYTISFFMLFLPGPIYWVASLSKEVLYYCFLAMLFYLLFENKRIISKRIIVISFVASLLSRFNIIAIIFFSKIFILLRSDSKISFIKNLTKIYLLIILVFILAISILKLVYDIDFFQTAMYIPLGFDVNALWGYKMDFVPMNIQELFYKLPIKFVLTIFSEVNIMYLFNFSYGNTNSYAIVFNTLEGFLRVTFVLLIIVNFIQKRYISVFAYKFMGITFVFWLLFAISIGFFQSRYLIFGDYLLIFSYIFLKSNRRR